MNHIAASQNGDPEDTEISFVKKEASTLGKNHFHGRKKPVSVSFLVLINPQNQVSYI